MKILYYRRHSLRNGDYISPEGLHLALKEGALSDVIFSEAFHGPLVRTAQTLLAFLMGTSIECTIHPVIEEIGTNDVLTSMANEAFRLGQGQDLPHLTCLRAAHDQATYDKYAATARLAVRKMFDAMEDGSFGIAFGHSPMIELSATGLEAHPEGKLPEGWDDLKEMDGLVFVQHDDGKLIVESVIRAKRD